jgi:anti-sigma28 factor (negative regulator of flagellin synthesis)
MEYRTKPKYKRPTQKEAVSLLLEVNSIMTVTIDEMEKKIEELTKKIEDIEYRIK